MKINLDHYTRVIILTTGLLATLAITPSYGYDPINLPKMLIISTGAGFLLPILFVDAQKFIQGNFLIVSLSFVLLSSLLISLFINQAPKFQQIWGIWGRSTGLVTYTAFILIMIAAAKVSTLEYSMIVRKLFERLSYFISFYTLLQAADLDPINWSQRLMVATLGNINFMSSFLGIASISFFARLVLENLPVSSRVHYLVMMILNMWLMWFSESIQGIGVFLAGASLCITFKLRERFSGRVAVSTLILTSCIGVIVFLGTLGLGPFSNFRQQTVIFRLDYWLAGIRMVKANWLNGVGVDSYGDYYTQFRDLDAATRTGPQRVTNTAHNIFLDVATGSGALAGFIFLTLFLLTFAKILSLLIKGEFSPTHATLSSMFLGFLFFCLISINQIGVGVWGFILMGLILGIHNNISTSSSVRFKSIKVQKESRSLDKNSTKHSLRISTSKLLTSSVIGITSFMLALTPNRFDSEMLRAVQSRNFERMDELSRQDISSTYHRNKYLALSLEAGRDNQALEFARFEVRRNGRNDFAWRVIAFKGTENKDEVLQSVEALKFLDPFNYELISELEGLVK